MGAADFSLERPEERWRVALFMARGAAGANFRRIPLEVPSLEDWQLPGVLSEVLPLPDGLVLVTGPAGSGKSSTMAALVRGILESRPVHVVTIEDPIEYVLPKGQGAVTQREVGEDTPDFAEGLRAALRQQPDVLLVGEIRDRETAGTALNAAETGSLVLSTLHTRSAPETLGRFLELFPDQERHRVLGQLCRVLKAVFSQMLLARADGTGLTAAVEVLRTSPSVVERIRTGDIAGLAEEVEASVSFHRMQSMNQSLAALVLTGVVARDEALRRSPSAGDLDLLLRNSRLVPAEEDPMGPSFCDYSKIHDLQELKKLHDDETTRHKEAEATMEARVREVEAVLEDTRAELQVEREKAAFLRKDWEEERQGLRERRETLDLAVSRLQRQASRLRERTAKRRWWRRLLPWLDRD
jgi:twitching motility protein PilT